MKSKLIQFFGKFKFAILFTGVYIVTIFIFALIFWGIGNQFYHSTAQYEIEVDEAYSNIKSELQKVVIHAFHDNHNHHTKFLDNQEGWMLHKDELIVDRFTSEGNRLTIYLTAYITNGTDMSIDENSTGFIQTNTRFVLKYGGISTFLEDDLVRKDSFDFQEVEKCDMEALGYSNFNVYKIFGNGVSKVAILELPFELIEDINAYDKSLNGFPSGLHGNFLRMLYLSMVTITTLGYGDIVPITDTARILVGIESVLGIVIIGWLATSLFNAFADN